VSFAGRVRALRVLVGAEGQGNGVESPALMLTVTDGVLRDVSREWACCRVTIEGEDRAAARLAAALGETLALWPATRSIGEEAIAASKGGGESVASGLTVAADASVDEAIRSVVGQLATACLSWAPEAARGETPVAVHQMRVAIRRLRSAMLVFKQPLAGSLDGLRPELAALAATLGAARDWDVFLGGTGAELGRALGEDKRIASLMADALRSREAAYEALRRHLRSPATRRLMLRLALLPALAPWSEGGAAGPEEEALLATPVGVFAPRILDRRYKRLVGEAEDLATLPAALLHETRKSGKKLRYALEFFAPVLPRRETRKLARRLSRAQDELGAINDTATGAALIAKLTKGGQHEFASGAVLGFLAARAEAARAPLAETWSALRRQERFWRHHHRRAAES
jgi:CHAD domain-containing protein